MFNKNNTKIVGGNIGDFRKSPQDIKLERINLDRQIYGLNKEDKVIDNRTLLAAKRNLNRPN